MSEPAPKKTNLPDASADDTHRPDECYATVDFSTELVSRSDIEPAAAIPESFGRYRILRQLGHGAMGTVYLALDTQLDRQVALKVPQFGRLKNPECLKRFFREARVMASLRHPNLCPVYDAGEIEGTHYLTMAYIQGQPLLQLMRPRWPQQQAAALFEKLGRALHEAHQAGIIHRDLKPSNIMIERGEPIIMDFGLATRQMTDDLTLTRTGAVVGTPAYMSPEQVSGDRHLGPATDIYSLGVILYQMLSGELPFQGSLVTVLGKIVMAEPPPLKDFYSDIDERLERICKKAMAKNPADRFEDGTKMSFALAAYLRGDPDPLADMPATEAMPSSPSGGSATFVPADGGTSQQPNVRPRDRRLAAAALILASLGSLVIGSIAWMSRRAEPDADDPNIARTNAVSTPRRSDPDEANWGPPPNSSPPSPAPPPSPVAAPAGPDTVAQTAQLSPREMALAALEKKDFSRAIELLNVITNQSEVTADDFANQGRAFFGQAEAGEDAVLNYRLAAEAFGRANQFEAQSQAQHAAARELERQARRLAQQFPADDPQLVNQDQEAIAAYRTAIDTAERHGVDSRSIETMQTELSALVNSPRFNVRAALKRQQESEAKIAAGQLALSFDPQQAVGLFTEALQLSAANSPLRWAILRDRSTAHWLMAHHSDGANNLQLAFDDIAASIEAFPPQPSKSSEGKARSVTDTDRAILHSMRARLLEELDEASPSASTLQQAAAAYELAARLDPKRFEYPLGAARSLLKLVQKDLPVEPPDPRLAKIGEVLAAAIGLEADSSEAHNLLGELSLLRGDVSAARAGFERAVEGNEPTAARRSRYFCNLSRSLLAPPVDAQRALSAAELAITIEASPTARYCRGQALRLLKQAPLEAIREFDQVLQSQPRNVEALLARSQLVVETRGISAVQVEQAYKDISAALSFASTAPLKAEAYYVQSIARLRDVVKLIEASSPQTLVEEALIRCQESAWQALKLDPQSTVYKKHAKEVFDNAARFNWQDAKLLRESTRLRQQFDNLTTAGRSSNK